MKALFLLSRRRTSSSRLRDSLWSRGKCRYKILQYGDAGFRPQGGRIVVRAVGARMTGKL